MKKLLAILMILAGCFFVIYALMVLVKCFALLSSTEFNSAGIGYSLGTLFGPMLLIAIARWMIRRGVKIFKAQLATKKKQAIDSVYLISQVVVIFHNRTYR